jgi:hypothetical protein
MAKDDPNRHAKCMCYGHRYYADAGIAPAGGVGNNSPWAKLWFPIDRQAEHSQLPAVI